MRIFKETPKFQHLEGEYFLADLGYVGASHCVHEYKATEIHLDDVEVFNHHVHIVRSRIERTFGWMDRYHMFWGTDREDAAVSEFVYLAFAVEQHRRFAEEPKYEVHYPLGAPTAWNLAPKCACKFDCGAATVAGAKDYRRDIIAHQCRIGCGMDSTKTYTK